MCTVLQQHLNQSSGYMGEMDMVTPSRASRHLSPGGRSSTPLYSYLQDTPNLRRPIDPYDRKCSTPATHFHLPPPERGRSTSAAGSTGSYLQSLLGRRSRSHSRTGMRVLVAQMQASAPRPRSPHMNNEEAISLSHYPDGRVPEEGRVTPIERDDFPAPPYVYGDGHKHRHSRHRRRHWSEPNARDSYDSDLTSATPSESEEEEEETEVVDAKLDRTEAELKKISDGGMGKVFLQEIAVERERRAQSKTRLIDPRSAARTPAAKKEPHFRLRYDSPINASPSRIADHLRPWDDEVDAIMGGGGGGMTSRCRSNVVTPFLPGTAMTMQHPMRVVSPINPIRPGYTQRAQTLPSRFSPGYDSDLIGDKTYSTDFSSNKSDDAGRSDTSGGGGGGRGGVITNGYENVRVSTAYTPGLQAATPRPASATSAQQQHLYQQQQQRQGSLPNMSPLQAPNIYPLHLLFTTNYRMPGDVDRCNLEKHLSDAEFDMVFRVGREDFYKLPYWKRCDLKRRYHLF